MPADEPDLKAAAIAYSDEIVRVRGAAPQLDVVLLGVGPDGHVASLFPGHPALSETRELVLPIVDSPKPPPRPLTLTFPLFAGAGRVIVMALGESKAGVLREAIERADTSLPVALALQRSRRALVLFGRRRRRVVVTCSVTTARDTAACPTRAKLENRANSPGSC
jgi:6-phosphogluconolactonase